MKYIMKYGFTLIELLLTITIMVAAILATVTYLNPSGQLAQSRNSQRLLHLNAVLNAIRQNIADNRGTFDCINGDIPTSTKRMAVGFGNYDIASCLSPNYLFGLPFDPATSTARFVSNLDYDTGYLIFKNIATGQITLSAPAAELGQNISVTR